MFTKELENKSLGRETETLYQVVARVSEDIREIIKSNNDRIFIGLTSHPIFDRFYVKSCSSCHRFGHYHAECSSTPCCGYCSAEDHISQDCPLYRTKDQTKYKCVNCQDAGL